MGRLFEKGPDDATSIVAYRDVAGPELVETLAWASNYTDHMPKLQPRFEIADDLVLPLEVIAPGEVVSTELSPQELEQTVDGLTDMTIAEPYELVFDTAKSQNKGPNGRHEVVLFASESDKYQQDRLHLLKAMASLAVVGKVDASSMFPTLPIYEYKATDFSQASDRNMYVALINIKQLLPVRVSVQMVRFAVMALD